MGASILHFPPMDESSLEYLYMIFATYPGLDWTKHPSDADEQEDKYDHWDKKSIYT